MTRWEDVRCARPDQDRPQPKVTGITLSKDKAIEGLSGVQCSHDDPTIGGSPEKEDVQCAGPNQD